MDNEEVGLISIPRAVVKKAGARNVDVRGKLPLTESNTPP